MTSYICCVLRQGLLKRWTLQLDLGITPGRLERVVSVHNRLLGYPRVDPRGDAKGDPKMDPK